ncbi:MAG: DNA polymerase III subunit beta [Acidobacteria bacterium]|nr:MAG: DNA polymerase III subunit beta [Acidobacteriota bacterium]
MKITIDQGALLAELNLLQGIIEKKATLPILSNVLLTAEEGGRLRLAATDLEIGFRSAVPATVEEPGSTTVHARRLHEIVRRLPAGNLGFRLREGRLQIQMERIRYNLATMDPAEFPALRERKGDPSAEVEAPVLADMIRRVVFAIAGEDPRYSIGGAKWELESGGLTMVATDGHRLARVRRPAGVRGKKPVEMVVPRKALVELQRLAADAEDLVAVWPQENSMFAEIAGREVSTSLQEPRFPDYRKVIPQANDKVFTIGREAFRKAIERVAVLSQEHTHLVKLELEEGTLRVSATSPHLGDAVEELEIEYPGPAFAIGFNAQYLLDFLAVAGTDRVRVALGEAMGQGLFQPLREDGADAGLLDDYVVMPMAL